MYDVTTDNVHLQVYNVIIHQKVITSTVIIYIYISFNKLVPLDLIMCSKPAYDIKK